MSTQRGNVSRTRPQKYRNKTKFKNDLHDTSHIIKNINKLEIVNVCIRCKSIIEWKIKYKKYKQLKNPTTCVSCHNKNVKHAYHKLCTDCATKQKVCPKCGEEKELVLPKADASEEESVQSSEEFKEKNNKLCSMQGETENADDESEKRIVRTLKTMQLNTNESDSSFESEESDGLSD